MNVQIIEETKSVQINASEVTCLMSAISLEGANSSDNAISMKTNQGLSLNKQITGDMSF